MGYSGQYWLEVVNILTDNMGMSLFSKTIKEEVYRKQIKNHILTIKILSEELDGYENIRLLTFLTINEANIWWHEFPHHSGYTLDDLGMFNETEFKNLIMYNSEEFLKLWR